MKVSVIVPVYNCEDWLRQCIDSLLCEDSPCEQEIILVDDGSTDNSGRICDEYASRYKSVRTIHTVNQGVSCARNLGLEQSLGEWIMFVDGDDGRLGTRRLVVLLRQVFESLPPNRTYTSRCIRLSVDKCTLFFMFLYLCVATWTYSESFSVSV